MIKISLFAMSYKHLGWTMARVLFGLFFLYSTITILFAHRGLQPIEAVAAARNFTNALNDSGFVNPLLVAVLLVGSVLLLLSDRLAPLGLILLAPPIALIAGFHWFLTGNCLWGSIWPLWLAALAWHYRAVFARLVEPGRPRRRGKDQLKA